MELRNRLLSANGGEGGIRTVRPRIRLRNLLILRCRRWHNCHCCRAALPDIARRRSRACVNFSGGFEVPAGGSSGRFFGLIPPYNVPRTEINLSCVTVRVAVFQTQQGINAIGLLSNFIAKKLAAPHMAKHTQGMREDALQTGSGHIMASIRKRIECGGERLWRLHDFPEFSFMAVVRALSRLKREGELERLSKGVYYRTRDTAFGKSRPNPVAVRVSRRNTRPSIPRVSPPQISSALRRNWLNAARSPPAA